MIEEKTLTKEVRNRIAFAPDYADLSVRFSLLEKTETYIKIKETHVTTNAPYADAFEVWIIWEILTPDPLSKLTAFRKQYYIEWFSRPAVRGTI